MTVKEKKKNKVIIEKVKSILDNTSNVTKLHIGIFADADEVPTIRYSIEEQLLDAKFIVDKGYME